MASQLSSQSDFAASFAIHVALKAAQRSKAYKGNDLAGTAAKALKKELEAPKSVYGRQLEMIRLMANGVSIKQLGSKLRCSRRTTFRYLSSLEQAGVPIELEDGQYHVDKKTVNMFSA